MMQKNYPSESAVSTSLLALRKGTSEPAHRGGHRLCRRKTLLGIMVDADSDGVDEQWVRPVRRLLPAFESPLTDCSRAVCYQLG